MARHTKFTSINEYIWTPLVYIPKNTKAFLTHPGTQIKPKTLSTGWTWHWPYLTSIVILNFDQQHYTFDSSATSHESIKDEDITAVSKDHHLLTIQGSLKLHLNQQSSNSILSKHDRHTEDRLIRPIIRQSVRIVIGSLDSAYCTPEIVQQQLTHHLSTTFDQHGIIISNVRVHKIFHFSPSITK